MMGKRGCSETSVNNYQRELRNIIEKNDDFIYTSVENWNHEFKRIISRRIGAYLETCQLSVVFVINVTFNNALRPAISTQVFLGFPVPKSKCWDDSQDSKLPLHASHVALPT